MSVLQPPGRLVWSDESQTLEFVNCCPADEGKRSQDNNVDFTELQQRAEWLADVSYRGRQSIRKSVSSAQLSAYRSSLMKKQGASVTMDDVKQVAVSLLQDNYLLSIPFCFLDVLKCKELDEVLAALLLYLSCFFEHKSLENKVASLVFVDIITEQQMLMETAAKKEISQKELAVSYFSLMMKLDRGQYLPHDKRQMMSNQTQWLLQACLYSFLCYFAWVTFDRKHLGDVQEEVGRLLYSDAFSQAVRNMADSGKTATAGKAEAADPKEARRNGAFKQRRSALSTAVNQRSPLMVSLLPSPKERSPHLFLSPRARGRSPPQAGRRDPEVLTEQLRQQLAAVSFGILGKPLSEFCHKTLTLKKTGCEDDESGRDVNNNSVDHPGLKVPIKFRGDRPSFGSGQGAGPNKCSYTAPCQ